ncbi:MAG TPA: hypothetical protein VF013_10270, partial [Candidatus Limnocylindria bacterium]
MPPRRTPARRAGGFDITAYADELVAFMAELGTDQFETLSGQRDLPATATIYERHAGLFKRSAVDALRAASIGDGEEQRRARALLAFAVEGFLERSVAALTDAVQAAEASAIIMWRGERIPYRSVPLRVAQMTDRVERNALQASYLEAVEAINPSRIERMERLRAAVADLGYDDEVDLARQLHGVDVEALAQDMRQFLLESETFYFAALRRYLAEIDIEQGDGSTADLSHLLRGAAWDAWFDPRRLMPTMERTLAGLGIDLRAQRHVTLDLEPRPTKSARAFMMPV